MPIEDNTVLSRKPEDRVDFQFTQLAERADDPAETGWRGFRLSFAFKFDKNKGQLADADFTLIGDVIRNMASAVNDAGAYLAYRGVILDGTITQLEAGPLDKDTAANLDAKRKQGEEQDRKAARATRGLRDALIAAGIPAEALPPLDNEGESSNLSDSEAKSESESPVEVTGLRIG